MSIEVAGVDESSGKSVKEERIWMDGQVKEVTENRVIGMGGGGENSDKIGLNMKYLLK